MRASCVSKQFQGLFDYFIPEIMFVVALQSTILNSVFMIYHVMRELIMYMFAYVGLCHLYKSPPREIQTGTAIDDARKNYGIVVTGTSTGIGHVTAEMLAGRGFTVFACVRTSEDAEKWSKLGYGDRIRTIILDVRDTESIKKACGQVSAWCNGGQGEGSNKIRQLHAIVNNAGIGSILPLEFTDDNELKEIMDVNFFGTVRVIKAFLPLLRQSRGRIINVGSVSGLCATPLFSVYSASKFALESLSDSLRVELAPQDIPVSLIEPGFISTPAFEKFEKEPAEIKTTDEYRMFTDTLRPLMITLGKYYSTSPNSVAMAVCHAVESSFPKIRYLVGIDATLLWLAKTVMPAFLFDDLVYYAVRAMNRSGTKMYERSQ